jgi:hypothetical protein
VPSIRIALVACGLVLAGVVVEGQPRISTAKSIRCSFARAAVGTWAKDGVPESATRTATLVLRFEAIDTDAGTAQLRTGSMAADVTVRAAEGYLHLMQSFRTGPLYTTTVFDQGASGGKFKAVHSRHEYYTVALPGATSSPEQYYGECEIVR